MKLLRMKQERMLKGFSGSELARRANMHSSSISSIERQTLIASQSQRDKIAAALDWKEDVDLLFEEVQL
jgi:transcriptional regulator with XRE-family HTH domain